MIPLSLPGHGAPWGDHSGRDWSLAREWTRDLDHHLDSSPTPALVVAFSLATAVLAHRIARAGTRQIAACVLLGGVPGPEVFSAEYQAIAPGVLHGRPDADRDLVDLYAFTTAGRAMVAANLARTSLEARHVVPLLPAAPPVRLNVPTTVVFGAQDALTQPPGESRLRSLAPAATLTTLDGAGHAVHLDRPAALAALISRIVRQTSSG
jgi:pimeloyl-ACP methyl ester carboxylesterase